MLFRIEKGDKQAWADFVEQYGRLIYYAIQQTLKRKGIQLSADEVEDIFHSLFVHFAENGAKRLLAYQGKRNCSFASWLRLVSINYTLDLIRQRRRGILEVDFEELSEEDFEKSWYQAPDTPEQISAELETEEKLKKALRSLSEEDQTFLKLYLSEMGPDKIAQIYKVSVSNIYSRYAKLKERLKKIIQDQD